MRLFEQQNIVSCTVIVGCTSSQGHLVSHESREYVMYVIIHGERGRGREDEREMGKKEPTLIDM